MYYTYILVNHNNRVMYIGITNDLQRRICEHKSGKIPGFTEKYRVNKLVFYEAYREVTAAIAREKQLKGWSRSKKNSLVEMMNPEWKNLYESLFKGLPRNEHTPDCHLERSEAIQI